MSRLEPAGSAERIANGRDPQLADGPGSDGVKRRQQQVTQRWPMCSVSRVLYVVEFAVHRTLGFQRFGGRRSNGNARAEFRRTPSWKVIELSAGTGTLGLSSRPWWGGGGRRADFLSPHLLPQRRKHRQGHAHVEPSRIQITGFTAFTTFVYAVKQRCRRPNEGVPTDRRAVLTVLTIGRDERQVKAVKAVTAPLGQDLQTP
jgi:hypothetical protein